MVSNITTGLRKVNHIIFSVIYHSHMDGSQLIETPKFKHGVSDRYVRMIAVRLGSGDTKTAVSV